LILQLGVSHPFDDSLRIRHESEQTRLEFIKTDLEICLTLADLVATKHRLGDSEHARQTLAKAEKGYSDVARLFAATKDLSPDIHQEIESGLKRLRERLDGLQRSNRQI
jgi:hypothetical protein